MITIIDYGMGNIGTIINKLEKLDISVQTTSDPSSILSAEKIILPGVGSFDAGIKNINALNLIESLQKAILEDKTPILGICLGMQLFTKKSEEGSLGGLGLFGCNTIKFRIPDFNNQMKIPHIGWNTIRILNTSPLLENINSDARFYFVHSYHVNCQIPGLVTAVTNYGYDFPSIIQKNNIYGVQFHPERSHSQGLTILKNFAEL